jgi:DNA modification methylase
MIDLYHADLLNSITLLPAQSFQTVAIDPPYMTNNTKAKYADSRMLKTKQWTNFAADWDSWPSQEAYQTDVTLWVEAIRRVMDTDACIWVCGSHHSIPTWDLTLKRLGFWVNQWVQWCIPNAMPNVAMTQMASSNQTIIWARKSQKSKLYYDKQAARLYNKGKNLRDFWLIPNSSTEARQGIDHPAKKPPALMERILHISTPPNGHVLDCFAGSGTTGFAARSLAIPCTLVEKEEKYVQVIERRLGIIRCNIQHQEASNA